MWGAMSVPGPVNESAVRMLGVGLLGWATGKVAAIKSGPEAIKTFCKINVVPMTMQILVSMQGGDTMQTVISLAFLAGYVYFGFVAKPPGCSGCGSGHSHGHGHGHGHKD